MMIFNGCVKITGGEFRTWYELIQAALDARTFLAQTGQTADEAKALYKSQFGGHAAGEVFMLPGANIYMIDAYKGVVNGVTTQASWAAGDFTMEPGGGELLTQGKHHDRHFELKNRVVYAVADTVIWLDVTIH